MFIIMFVAFVAFAPFHSCHIFASLCTQGASNLAAFVSGIDICLSSCSMMSDSLITPRAHARARGYVIGCGVYILSALFLEPIFYLPKYSLSEVYSNTDRFLIEFNGLWYSLAARQVFVVITNPDSLSFG